MSQPPEPAKPVPDPGEFRLGQWTVHQAEGTLSSQGRSLRLEPRVMDVLVHLASAPGKVISKEELLEAVWQGAFVEEGALSHVIHSLRKALGDDAHQPLSLGRLWKSQGRTQDARELVAQTCQGFTGTSRDLREAGAFLDSCSTEDGSSRI